MFYSDVCIVNKKKTKMKHRQLCFANIILVVEYDVLRTYSSCCTHYSSSCYCTLLAYKSYLPNGIKKERKKKIKKSHMHVCMHVC